MSLNTIHDRQPIKMPIVKAKEHETKNPEMNAPEVEV